MIYKKNIFNLNKSYNNDALFEFCFKRMNRLNYKGVFNDNEVEKIVIIRHNDLDGEGSAASIIYQLFTNGFDEIETEIYSMDYSQPFNIEIKDNYEYWLVDYSITSKENIEFAKKNFVGKSNVVWIDHHASSIKTINENPELKKINGIVIKEQLSGALLTWILCKIFSGFFSSQKIPMIIKYISDYDTFSHNLDNTIQFFYGISAINTDPSNTSLWRQLIEEPYNIMELKSNGEIINKYITQTTNEIMNEIGFEYNFGYKTFCVNRKMNSIMFGNKFKEYDIVCSFYFDGKTWTYSLYTDYDNIDVSEIAESYGGGGHKKAAGFTSDKNIFSK